MPSLRLAACGLVAAFAALAPAASVAGADGPDFYRVVALRPGDKLALRERPQPAARVLAFVPPGARLRNLGQTSGGLSFSEWERASPARRAQARRTMWRLVEHRRVRGWARAVHLAE